MKKFIITIDFEEWFHSEWFNPNEVISRYFSGKKPTTDTWKTMKKLLDLFKRYSINATFFCLVETSKIYPDIIKMIVDDGHEIALHGVSHQNIVDRERFRKDICYGKCFLEELSGSEVLGYRAPNFKIPLWGFKVLSESGFIYDSSLVPCFSIPGWYGSSSTPTRPYVVWPGKYDLIEFPLTVFPLLRIPGSGGWFLRNFGFKWIKILLKTHLRKHDIAILYLHPWELSEDNPKLPEIPFHVFRRTGKWTLENLRRIIENFKDYVSFTSFKEYLNENSIF